MLKLNNIKKSYKTGDFLQHALKGVNINFRKNEFVAILGPSGSGKTTLLNVIGGLDKYDSGDLIINNKSTKKFKDRNWDSYRNNCIGFIFQSYNLISHISVLKNVEMSTTLSGYSKRRRKKMAIEALDRVGLKDHINKKPNQLSGGQMQRVAIARALVNNPDIILADEPTGALDTKTSTQIMNLIKEVAKDKLVIMVTHNPDLAKEYANRIIEFKDGEIISDSNPFNDEKEKTDSINIKKTKMSYRSAIGLSFNNLRTKKGRTFITSLASSIGIIGIALILSLSNGFKIKIDEYERSTLSQMPIIVSTQSIDLNNLSFEEDNLDKYTDKEEVYPLETIVDNIHNNKITNDYVDYINNADSNLISGISYIRLTNIAALKKTDDKVSFINTRAFVSLPSTLDNKVSSIVTDNFECIKGEITDNKEDLYLLIDEKNRIDKNILKALGYDEEEKISFDELLNREYKLVLNDDYYDYNEDYGLFTPKTDLNSLYESDNSITLKIKAIIRGKKDNEFARMSSTGLIYNESLIKYIVDNNSKSKIVLNQRDKDYNVLTRETFDYISEEKKEEKNQLLAYLGDDIAPNTISIYPKDFDTKEDLLKYLDNYNKNKEEVDQIKYIDQASLITTLSGNIMDGITVVLIAFSSISLVVSSIMVGIITYTSVLERTKEIGILRALGARKKDISRVFNAETLIIGLFSGALGILIARLLCIPINNLIENLSGLDNVAKLNPMHALFLVIISITLTLIGGFIPSKIASKKDPVNALRTD